MAGHEANIVGRLPWLREIEEALDWLCSFLAAERPMRQLLLLSFLAAAVYCVLLFDVHVLLGTSEYWSNPRGVVSKSWADIPAALSGYAFFQRDSWQLPLFHVSKLGAPEGVNIIFTDSVPWVALAGRIAFLATGAAVNLYGAWTALCFIASAVTLTALVATFGQRNLAAAAMATLTGLTMPALLARWGHMSLMAQFEIPLALIFYFRNSRTENPRAVFCQAAGLTWLALWTHAYLFAMVLAIVLATIGQAVTSGKLKWRAAAAITAGLAAFLGVLIVLSGYLSSRGSLADDGFGSNSLNLLSPFIPQKSGLVPSLRNFIVDVTNGQYEGFSYLGGGVLLLLFANVVWRAKTLALSCARNPWLLAVLIGLTIFAASNVVYLGPLKVLDLHLNEHIAHFASIFRSSGRFVWPVLYCVAAWAIATTLPTYGRGGVIMILMAMSLQWIDTAPLREAISDRTSAPENSAMDVDAWRSEIARHRSVRVLPEYFCLSDFDRWSQQIAVQIQLIAALADRSVNSVYASRFASDCAAEQKVDGLPRPGAGELTVFLNQFADIDRVRALAADSMSCQAGPGMVVCSDIPDQTAQLAALARTVWQWQIYRFY